MAPAAKVIIAILLVQLVLMAEARTQEGHAPAGEIFEESHGIRHLMAWQPPTLEGHSPGVGHATPPKASESHNSPLTAHETESLLR